MTLWLTVAGAALATFQPASAMVEPGQPQGEGVPAAAASATPLAPGGLPLAITREELAAALAPYDRLVRPCFAEMARKLAHNLEGNLAFEAARYGRQASLDVLPAERDQLRNDLLSREITAQFPGSPRAQVLLMVALSQTKNPPGGLG